MAKLLALQRGDGSRDKGVVYQFTRVEGVAWHQGFTVSLAVLMIEKCGGDDAGVGTANVWHLFHWLEFCACIHA